MSTNYVYDGLSPATAADWTSSAEWSTPEGFPPFDGQIDPGDTVAIDDAIFNFDGDYTISNAGTLDGDDLTLVDFTLDQTGGGALDAVGGYVTLSNDGLVGFVDTIEGGSLNSSAGAQFVVSGDSGDDVLLDGSTATLTNNATIDVQNSAVLSTTGAVVNSSSGEIDLAATSSDLGNGSRLVVNASLTNAGAIVMSDASPPGNDAVLGGGNAILIADGPGIELDNFATISGSGDILGLGGPGLPGALVNEAGATIDANGVNPLQITNLALTNLGTLEASNGGTLFLDLATIANASLTNSGHLVADGGAILLAPGVSIASSAETVTNGGQIVTVSQAILGSEYVGDAGKDVQSVTLDGSVGPIWIGATGKIEVDWGDAILATSQSNPFVIDNYGTIALSASLNYPSDLVVGAGANTVELAGDGVVSMSDNIHNEIYTEVYGTTLDNQGNTIEGAGTIDGDGLTLENEAAGTIDATGAVNALIVISANNFSNAGTLESTGAGGLSLQSDTIAQTGSGVLKTAGGGVTLEGVTTVTGGAATVAAGDTMTLNAGSIIGATVTVNGVLQAIGGADEVDGVITIGNGAQIDALNGTILDLASAAPILNQGTITVGASSQGATLEIGDASSANVTLSGGGTVSLGDNPTSTIETNLSVLQSRTLENFNDTIQGAGYINGNFGLTIQNDQGGMIDASGVNNALTIYSASNVANAGTIEATGVGGLDLQFDSITQTASGLIEADGAGGATTSVSIQNSEISGGTIEAYGVGGILDPAVTIASSTLDNTNLVAAGAQGTVTIGANTTLSGASATLSDGGAIDIAATFNGPVTFNGTGDTLSLAQPELNFTNPDMLGPISGFAAGDRIDLTSLASVDSISYSSDGQGDTIVTITGESTANLSVTEQLSFAGAQYANNISLTSDNGTGQFVETDVTCYMAGTRILTCSGEVAVETLRPGDFVVTADGRAARVNWLGRQTVSTMFADKLRVLPIRVKAGALDEGVPVRDLLVSPDHAIFIDGILVHAGALINGTSVVRETAVPAVFTYYHVELDAHALLLAEGAPAESFVDNVERLGFDNWDEFETLYPEGRAVEEMPYPRAKSHRQVPAAVRRLLAERALRIGAGDVAQVA